MTAGLCGQVREILMRDEDWACFQKPSAEDFHAIVGCLQLVCLEP